MKINTLKKFRKKYSYMKSLIKPIYHKYIDQLPENYIARKITNIKTVDNHLNKLSGKGAKITAKKLNKLFDKLNTFNDLPSYTTD